MNRQARSHPPRRAEIEGKSTSEISSELDVATSTVRTYGKRIRDMTGAASIRELITLHFRSY